VIWDACGTGVKRSHQEADNGFVQIAGNRLRLRSGWGLVVLAALLVTVLVIASSRYWYTPTTSDAVVNDTAHTVALDNCEDTVVVIAPGQTQSVAPFVHGPGCSVYEGTTNVGPASGCLEFPERNGSVLAGQTVRVSEARSGACSD
jgi:hypothetical protein